MIDYGNFAARLAARTDRWGLLIEFQREWGYLGETNRGFALPTADEDAEEDDAEYCPVVPEAVTQWYALPQNSFMQAARLYWTHPHVPPTRWPCTDELAQATDSGLVPVLRPERRGVFMAEYQYCWTWSYLERDAAGNPDPPVYLANTELSGSDFKQLLEGKRSPGEYLAARSVSEWALAFAATSIPFSIAAAATAGEMDASLVDRPLIDQHATHAENDLTDEQFALIEENFPLLGLLPWHGFGCFELRGGRDVILSVLRPMPEDYEYWQGDFDFEIAGRTKQALADALEVIGLGG